jgi:molybdopterin synthase catalytic subunit
VFAVVREPIDPRTFDDTIRAGDGGAVRFFGVVRARADDGRAVRGLSYEAFELLAVAEFERIAGEVRERFGDVALAIVHRIGEIGVGEVSVAIVASAAHRDAAFDACRYAIDELKRRAPIWKKERYADGSARWRENEPVS